MQAEWATVEAEAPRATVEAEAPRATVDSTARSERVKMGRLVEAVNRVIHRRDITTVFQPLENLGTGAVAGYEAIARDHSMTIVIKVQPLGGGKRWPR